MPLQIDSGDIQRHGANSEAHVVRGAVPPHEKLLLLAILVVVAGWISFRLALMLFAAFG